MSWRTNRRTRNRFITGIRESGRGESEIERVLSSGNTGWKAIRDNFGDMGRRWMLHRSIDSDDKEELTIEDGENGSGYEIVTHDFKSGDIDTVDYAKTLNAAESKVARYLRNNPAGAY